MIWVCDVIRIAKCRIVTIIRYDKYRCIIMYIHVAGGIIALITWSRYIMSDSTSYCWLSSFTSYWGKLRSLSEWIWYASFLLLLQELLLIEKWGTVQVFMTMKSSYMVRLHEDQCSSTCSSSLRSAWAVLCIPTTY